MIFDNPIFDFKFQYSQLSRVVWKYLVTNSLNPCQHVSVLSVESSGLEVPAAIAAGMSVLSVSVLSVESSGLEVSSFAGVVVPSASFSTLS